jgi:DNA-binding Xre family transcriptional regulator
MLDWPSFGSMVHAQRLLKDKGIRELARELRIAPSTMVKLDYGKPVSADILVRICDSLLDIDPRKLLMGVREDGQG